jgi:hypothetical protein
LHSPFKLKIDGFAISLISGLRWHLWERLLASIFAAGKPLPQSETKFVSSACSAVFSGELALFAKPSMSDDFFRVHPNDM